MRPEALAERRAFKEHMRARIRLVAHERNIPKEDVKAAMGLKHFPLLVFMRKHRLSIDWVVFGDLKGLLRQVRYRARSGR
jgi:hypothetical protein